MRSRAFTAPMETSLALNVRCVTWPSPPRWSSAKGSASRSPRFAPAGCCVLEAQVEAFGPSEPLEPAERLVRALRDGRAQLGVGQAEVAILVRSHRARIADYEIGARLPPPSELYRLAELYANGAEIVAAWVEVKGALPISIYSETVPRYPHPLALQVATSFAAWWPKLSRGDTPEVRGALSVLRWALAKLGESPEPEA